MGVKPLNYIREGMTMYRIMIAQSKRDNFASLYQYLTTNVDGEVSPLELESKEELDLFVKTMEAIYDEIKEVKEGKYTMEDNVLVNSPHPEYEAVADEWNHSYPRTKAFYPIEEVRDNKFWIDVARVDNTLGDRHLLPTLYGTFE